MHMAMKCHSVGLYDNSIRWYCILSEKYAASKKKPRFHLIFLLKVPYFGHKFPILPQNLAILVRLWSGRSEPYTDVLHNSSHTGSGIIMYGLSLKLWILRLIEVVHRSFSKRKQAKDYNRGFGKIRHNSPKLAANDLYT